MDKPRIEIQTLGGVFAKVVVDGKEIEDVTGYRVEHRAGELPHLYLEMKATNMAINEKVVPALPEPYSHFYVSKNLLLDKGFLTKSQIEEL